MKVQKSKRNSKSSNGRWSKTQHDRFMKGLERFGRDWVSVQKFVKTRTLTQVRSHAQKVFLKLSQKDIQALIANEDQYQMPKNCQPMENQNQECIDQVSQLSEPKSSAKKQVNLLNIFMQAIEQQSKQLPQMHDMTQFNEEFPEKQRTDVQKAKEEVLCKDDEEKQNKVQNEIKNQKQLEKQKSTNEGEYTYRVHPTCGALSNQNIIN